MKALLPLLLSLILFSFTKQSIASHYMGGEITWECIPAGQPDAGKFIFTLTSYLDCHGIAYASTQNLSSTSPSGNITMNLVTGWPKDISPVCDISKFSGTGVTEITCSGAGNSNSGAVSEYRFRSAPIQLSGVPPTAGWDFSWSACCRNPATNCNGAPGWKLVSKMYAYNNQNTYPCFDNSPEFAEQPIRFLNTGFPSGYSNYAFDKEFDVLNYQWGEPLVGNSYTLSYNSGYSYYSPFPDTSTNANNIGAVMDSKTGYVSFTSFTTGNFITSVKVSAYKEGLLVAEIWREIQVLLVAPGNNNPPSVNFDNNINNIIRDTITAGDTINAIIAGQDYSFYPDASPQVIELEVFGKQFGSYIQASGSSAATFSQTSGCLRPPCASLTPAPDTSNVISATQNLQSNFYWETNIDNLPFDTVYGYKSFTYDFIFRFNDKYCPSPATVTKILSITINPPLMLNVPMIESVAKEPNSDIVLKWSPITNDVDTLFQVYYIYMANGGSANFTILDSITNPNIGTYTIVNPPSSLVSFRLGLKQKCLNDFVITRSEIVSNIDISYSKVANCVYKLIWNSFSETDINESYYIFKKSPLNVWNMIQSTQQNSFIDTSFSNLSYYKIQTNSHQLYDSLGNVNNTKSKSDVSILNSHLNIGPDSSIFENESIYIYSILGFDTYEWFDGATNQYAMLYGNVLGVGTHDVWLKANTNYGCMKADTFILEVQPFISINDSKNESNIDIFPNPTNGLFNLHINTTITQSIDIDIVSIDGKSIYKNNVSLLTKHEIVKIDISSAAEGVYYIKIKGENIDIVKPITVHK